MMKTLKTAMTTSISEVLETMFYLPVEIGEESTLIQSGMDMDLPNLACQLNFIGDFSGNFTLVIPKNLLEEITEDFMGESRESLEEEHLLGTLTEILNMICGNALKKIKSNIPFDLDIPKVIDECKILENQVFAIVETPQSKMAVSLVLA